MTTLERERAEAEWEAWQEEELREAQEACQREMAADLARKHGGKFRHARGNDASGRDVAEVHQQS